MILPGKITAQGWRLRQRRAAGWVGTMTCPVLGALAVSAVGTAWVPPSSAMGGRALARLAQT